FISPTKLLAVGIAGLGIPVAPVLAADLYHNTPTPIKAPDCLQASDMQHFFYAWDAAAMYYPPLPQDRFFLVVRHMGVNSISSLPAYDFGTFDDDYPYPPYRGLPVTGLSVPDPKSTWQRARISTATVDTASAFQAHCYDVGSFINSWTYAYEDLVNGGVHALLGYRFSDPPPVFDSNPATDFGLQGSFAVPWVSTWSDTTQEPPITPVGQVSLYAYFEDMASQQLFAYILLIYDNRYPDTSSPYEPTIRHDGSVPFVSRPIDSNPRYATLSPYSAVFIGRKWSRLKFFRMHITQANFSDAIADINGFCAVHRSDDNCRYVFSANVLRYRLVSFGVLHEIAQRTPDNNISMGVHMYGVGAWNFR
ncbi:MAG: hypothetical protein WBQ57_10235, partial [Rhodanobacteraceae bacterium]